MFNNATSQLRKPGAIGVIPTDTVYGVVARAADKAAVARLYKLKRRENKPGTLIAANLEQLEELGLKHRYLKAVEGYWPGAVSVVIPASDPAMAYLHQGKMSLAVRLPANKELRKLLEQAGALITSSANLPDEPTAVNIEQARAYFGDKVDFYVDGGDLSNRQPSTLIRIIDDAVEVLREGAVKIPDAGTM
ncbi:MAG TPA: L-threonylcarbamoyladenylate synthase [Candidatus Saccharimonadales bacterium]|jgi:L-threonylcarbamoyladenylate synthase|nr:L-threonylcarbamoyladenylate synthase [Candidatus Saccharimonadales bacterium]